jgi:5-methylcytosine-specific restriction enzyme B
MADILCRWRNSSIKQALEFSALFPGHTVSKETGRDIVEKRWNDIGGNNFFTTPYQLAAQMGIYVEDKGFMYSRFIAPISIEKAKEYMNYWGRHYYAPNPYSKSLDYTQQPIILNNYLVNWVFDHEQALLSEALAAAFTDTLGNLDILENMLNTFSDVNINDDVMTLKPTAPSDKFENTILNVKPDDKLAFYNYVGLFGEITTKEYGYNKIFYGAPGTGKSHTVEENYVKGHKDFRITFHPDTDYASFVGCYKPSMSGPDEDQIAYEFVPQVFLKAYEYAWNHPGEKTFLIIEELNRGNCAQIFGDVFQLLDRRVDDYPGFSKYKINADTDIAKYLKKHIDNKDGVYGNKIKEIYGLDEFDFSLMAIPDNLYILATMNTSDQSLFPIDSAFKRRWEWEYVKVDYNDASGFYLKIDDNHKYNWDKVLRGLNDYIKSETHNTNKILGNRFVQAGADNIISARAFRDKVLFFLFNDVFKDDDDFKAAFFGDNSENKFFEDLCVTDDTELTIRFIEGICGADNIATANALDAETSESSAE